MSALSSLLSTPRKSCPDRWILFSRFKNAEKIRLKYRSITMATWIVRSKLNRRVAQEAPAPGSPVPSTPRRGCCPAAWVSTPLEIHQFIQLMESCSTVAVETHAK